MFGEDGRIGQGYYWMWFVLCTIGTVVLLVAAVWGLAKQNLAVAALALLWLLPTILYFRVIAARRCRDIGWPAFLPGALLVAVIVAGVVFRPAVASGVANLAGAMIAGLINLIDFGFAIAIGCFKAEHHIVYDYIDDRAKAIAKLRGEFTGPAATNGTAPLQGSRIEEPITVTDRFGRRSL